MQICPRCAELLPDDGRFCPFDGAELTRTSDPFLGRTISGRFRLIKRIGTGGMSTVYLARHVMIDRLNAIKILRPDLSLNPNHRERFLREARAVNRINHRNIVEITDYGEVDSALFLVMEYIAGESLLAHMGRGPMPWDRAARIALQIASALARAHQAGVVHRDLKPENVMLLQLPDFPDLVKLTDFGIAKILDAPALTFTEQMFGTPGYIAPEYLDGLAPDGRADLYALGVVLYEMIAGKLPYEYRGSSDLLMKPLTSAPIPLGTRVSDVPPEIDSLTLRMLARYRDERPGDAFEIHEVLLDTLRRYAADEPLLAVGYPEGGRIADGRVVDGRDAVPTLFDEIIDLDADSGRPTTNVGRIQTSEMASRWNAALEELDTAIARALRRGGSRAKGAAHAQHLAAHARDVAAAVERGQAKVADYQAKADRLEARGREFRAQLGRAIDDAVRERSRERARIASIRAGRLNGPPPPRSDLRADAHLWETEVLAAEEARTVDVELDLSARIDELQARLDAENEAFEGELLEAHAILEGAISAVRQLTHELVRTLDEATALCSKP